MQAETKRKSSFDSGIAAEYFILSQLYRFGVEAYMSQGNKKAINIRGRIQPCIKLKIQPLINGWIAHYLQDGNTNRLVESES